MKSNEYTVLVGFGWFWAILNGIWMDFYEMFSTTKTCQVFISGSLHGVTWYWSPDDCNFSSLPFEPQWTAEGRRCWMVPVRPSDTSPVQQKSDQINRRRKRKPHFESLRYIQFNDSYTLNTHKQDQTINFTGESFQVMSTSDISRPWENHRKSRSVFKGFGAALRRFQHPTVLKTTVWRTGKVPVRSLLGTNMHQ